MKQASISHNQTRKQAAGGGIDRETLHRVPVIGFTAAPLTFLLLVLVEATSLAAGAAGAQACAHPVAGGVPWPGVAALAAITLSETQVGLSVLAVIASLIGYHFTVGKYIRQQAGVKETVNNVIVNKPLITRAEVEFVPVPIFEDLKKYVHEAQHENRNSFNAVSLLMEERRNDSVRQVGALKDQINEKVAEAIHASNTSASKVHQRIDKLADTQGVLIGEIKHITKAAEKAGDAANAAALKAAEAVAKVEARKG